MQYKNPNIDHSKVTNRRKITGVHFHDDYELYYLIDGETKYFIGSEIFHLDAGNTIIVPKGMLHKTDSEECLHNERICINFDAELLDDGVVSILSTLCEKKLICISDSNLYKVAELLNRLDKENEKSADFKDTLLRLYINELLILLFRFQKEQNEAFSTVDVIISDITHYIKNNFSNELSLKALSRRFAVSESHLSRKFKSVSGIGLNEYITYVRILNAEKLLSVGKLSVTEISERCGFNDSNYFATVFKKLKGVTPYKYMQLNRK